MSLFKNIALVIVSPKLGWDEINQSGYPTQKLLSGAFYPLLAVLAIVAFVPMIYDSTITLANSIMTAVIAFTSFFLTYLICSYFLGGFYPELVHTHASAERLNDFVIYNLIFLIFLSILNFLLPTHFTPLYFLILYMAYIAYRGVDFLGLKREKVLKFVLISSAMMIALPFLIKLLLTAIFIH
jgi:hypothetical protein